VPEGTDGDHLISLLAERFERAETAVLLNDRVESSFHNSRDRLLAIAGMERVGQEPAHSTSGSHASPSLLTIDASETFGTIIEEAFGPLIIIVRYSTQGDLQQALLSVPPSLTASIHSAETDRASVVDLIALVQPRTGRLVFDGYPTGVRVSWGQHHDSFVLLPGKMLRRMFCLMNFTTDTWEFLEGLTVSCMTRNRDSRLYFQPGFEL
jgi:NADP-dependent aldehyde dehydrogenase